MPALGHFASQERQLRSNHWGCRIALGRDCAHFTEMVLASSARMTLTAVRSMPAVEAAWRTLEAEADPSFFQSWTWVGCLAEERFRRPVLLTASRDNRTVGLALLNCTPGPFGSERLWLNESGDPVLDSVYTEHNGFLLARDATDLLPACLWTMLRGPIQPDMQQAGTWGRRLRLAGVDSAHLAAGQKAGTVRLLKKTVAPFVNLASLAPGPDGYLTTLSGNTRYQLRRSNRCFARLGPIELRQAETEPEALAFLDALANLHQNTWVARGERGAFANPQFLRFHRALVARALPRNELELLRISAGGQILGYLYNFRLRGRVFTYQSGFDYAAAAALAGPHAKPGLTCHYTAILRAQSDGAVSYDFLAGPDRYKSSLTRAATPLYWLDAVPRFSGQSMALWLKGLAGWR
ncbi:MAG TPA: GNAT family N-acetyltransferase [Acetobacteraceae bacterium]|nr:GNAT family N-acetyltransferase [Acetobacteraceae bacterium]